MSATTFKSNLTIVSNTGNSNNKLHHYGYQPLKAGNTAPSFFIPTSDGIATHLASGSLSRELSISLQDFLDNQQPLVVAFVGASNDHFPELGLLENLQSSIRQNGGSLLVLTNVEAKLLRRKIRNQNNLTIFHDKDNAIAELFGVYDYKNPLWQWVSGVDAEDESLPALYVVAPDREIVFSHVDYQFSFFKQYNYSSEPIIKNLLQQVASVAKQFQFRPAELYKKVS